MQLRLISAQGGSFEDYYAECGPPTGSPYYLGAIERTKSLLRHLEQVEGPPQWVTISLLLLFRLSDEDDYRSENANVCVDTQRNYKISFRSGQAPPEGELFTTQETDDLLTAGNIIRDALRRRLVVTEALQQNPATTENCP